MTSKKPTHLHHTDTAETGVIVEQVDGNYALYGDADIVDAEVIEEGKGGELEVAPFPLVPLPERLLLDQLLNRRRTLDERAEQVEKTLLTITTLNPQYAQPVGRQIDHEWPACPSYEDLLTEAEREEWRKLAREDQIGTHLHELTERVAGVNVRTQDQIATQQFPRIAELLGETNVE